MSRKPRRTYTTSRFYPSAPRDISNHNLTRSVASAFDLGSWADVEQALWSPSSTSIRSSSPEIEDRRLWHPDGRPKSSRSSRRSRIPFQAHKSPSNFDVPVHVAFKAPRYVAVCIRRKNRRQVLLALGRGGGRHRRPRRNSLSNVRC